MKTVEIGKIGEEKAVEFLRKNRYKIIERNYRTKIGEIDIIARKNREIVFIEVKLRTSNKFGLPQESVNKKKIEKIEKISQIYLNSKKINLPYRFETLSIIKDGENLNFEIIPID